MIKGRHFDQTVILLCVHWNLAYNLSLRNLVWGDSMYIRFLRDVAVQPSAACSVGARLRSLMRSFALF
jgi:hypothetical protein